MYILNQFKFRSYNSTQAQAFVDFWNRYYDYSITVFGTKIPIDYFSELNIGRSLTDENIMRLLRWKDPKYLTRTIQSGTAKGTANPRVKKVIAKLNDINKFRCGALCEDEFKKITRGVFPNGIVWQVFLFHIAKPSTYPIVDQHVLRVMSAHTGKSTAPNWTTYEHYREYFSSIADECNIPIDETHFKQLKTVDNALMAFGQFLKRYDT